MALVTCALDTITKPENCNDRGGFRSFYWIEYNKIDWDALIADPLAFDPVNELVLDYTNHMIAGAVFNKIDFDRESAFYDFTYTEDTDLYTLLITMFFKGKQADRRNKLQRAIACCSVYSHLYSNDGTQRSIGIDYNGETGVPILDELSITRHLDSGGQLGTSRARDEMDLGGKAFFAPLFATVPEASIPLV